MQPSLGLKVGLGATAENKLMRPAIMSSLSFPWEEADALMALLVSRAASLVNCGPGSRDEREFDELV